MDKLHLILVNDNVIRSTLEDLASRTGADYWLVASPHYLAKLSDQHRAIFSRIICQEDFATPALAERLGWELAGVHPAKLAFLTNDESCEIACAELQQAFAAPMWTAEQLLPFINKMVSKQALARVGIRLPNHLPFDKRRYAVERDAYCQHLAETIGFPMIVKPVDRYASMDVRRLETVHELRAWAAWCVSPKDRNTYEIDEFIEGELFHCDSLIQHGAIIWSNACPNVNPCLQFTAGRSIGAYTVPTDRKDTAAIRAFNARVLAALDPPDGATHMECFRTAGGELVFLEISARPPGGDLVGLYRHCFGFDMDVAHFVLRAREPYRLELAGQTRYAGWVIHPKRHGRIKAIHAPVLHSRARVRLRVAAGEVIAASSRHIVDEPAAEFWLYSDDHEQIARDCRTLKELRLCEMDD